MHLTDEAERLAFATERRIIDPQQEWEPERDAVVVCGPASAHVGLMLLAHDPLITMTIADGPRWYIVDQETGEQYGSPMDDTEPRRADRAYLARHVIPRGARVVHIAGLHALGSIGAAHYLTDHLAHLWNELGDVSFSLVVEGDFDGTTPIALRRAAPETMATMTTHGALLPEARAPAKADGQ